MSKGPKSLFRLSVETSVQRGVETKQSSFQTRLNLRGSAQRERKRERERETENSFQSSSAGISLPPSVETPSCSLSFFCRINTRSCAVRQSVHRTYTHTITRTGTYRRRRRIDPTAEHRELSRTYTCGLHTSRRDAQLLYVYIYLRMSVCTTTTAIQFVGAILPTRECMIAQTCVGLREPIRNVTVLACDSVTE